MADGTAIQWTDATCDPVRGWTKITHGCNNFYAARGTAESKRPGSALRARDLFEHNPFLTANELFERAGLSPVVVNATLADLERFGVVEKATSRRRGRVFKYQRYLAAVSEGVKPLPSAS